uniref:Ig-like domain-containing protein n=1 Tax=Terrapene triunguis TaxID=2587831 RepID=A0A674JFM1_9SAUR
MDRALLPQHDVGEKELWARAPPWRAGGPATLRVLILALLWRGSLSQLPGFTLAVPQSVSVQEGLCVLIPCTFTYPASYDTDNSWARLNRYWYKDPADVDQNPPVASSDPNQRVSQETQGRFRLAKNPAPGDCSLQISDARQTDEGRYFLRVKKGTLKYNYRSSTDGLTEEPEIQISPAQRVPGTLLAQEPVNVTCTAPGRCSGTLPKVTWTGPFSDTARDVSAQLANGTWAHSSELSFTPTPGDHGKELICTVTYSSAQGPSTRRTVQLHIGCECPPAQLLRVGPNPSTPVGNGSQLTAREGDSLRFLCSIASSPPATLAWVRGGRAIEGAHPAGENQLRLELPNVTAEDGGLYGCWAQNKESSAQGTFQLLVECECGTGLNSSCQRQGPSVSCSCSLRSHPPPQLQWQVDGEPMAGNGSRGPLQVSSWAQGDEAISTLSWTGSGDRSPRIFCLGSNPHGTYAALHFELSPPQRGETLGLLGSVPSSGREPGLLGSLPSPGKRVGSGCWKQGSWEPGLLDTIHRPGSGVGSSGKSRGPEARTPGFSPSCAPCCVFLQVRRSLASCWASGWPVGWGSPSASSFSGSV